MSDIFCHAHVDAPELAPYERLISCPRCKGVAIHSCDDVLEGGCFNRYDNTVCIECDYKAGDFRDFGSDSTFYPSAYPEEFGADFAEDYAA